MTSLTDANGATTKYSYDVLGRPVQVTNPDGGSVQYTYQFTTNAWGQPNGQLTHQTVSDGGANALWTFTFSDGLGRTYRTVKKGGYVNNIQFSDSTGNPSADSGWYSPPNAPQWTHYTYDGAKRLITVTLPDSNRRSTAYAIGKVTKLDELGRDTTYYIDAYGRTTKVVEHNGDSSYPTTSYTYDVLGELTQVQDAAGNYSSITWDMLGRKCAQTDPDMGRWSYKYDAVGNVLAQTDGKGQTINFTYDALNRLLSKTYPDGSKVVRNYDESGRGAGLGRLTTISELLPGGRPKGLDSFSYDTMGRVTSSRKCRLKYCFTTNSIYDKFGRVSQLIYPDPAGRISARSETVTYTYDQSGHLSSIMGVVPYLTAVGYEQAGQISSISYGNGVSAHFLYDPARRWLNAAAVVGSGSPQPTLYDAAYQHDPAGHIIAISSSTDQSFNLNFAYDPLGRLTQVSGAQTQQFAYDDIGNITSNSGVGPYSYGVTQNCSPPTPCFTHPHAVTKAGNSTYAYDANGNMTSGAGRTITWNYDNLPVTVTTDAGTTISDYDGSGQRVSKAEPADSAPTYYFSPLVERTPSGDVVYSYYAGQMLLARRTVSSSTVTWYHQDHLASVRLITDAKGNVIHNYDYATFGTTLVPVGDPPNPYGFTGQLRNPSTSVSQGDAAGLIYMNARYYDATLGRFISADSIIPNPLNPQSLNRYSYVLNNPVSFNDPTGHIQLCVGCRPVNNGGVVGWFVWDSGGGKGGSFMEPVFGQYSDGTGGEGDSIHQTSETTALSPPPLLNAPDADVPPTPPPLVDATGQSGSTSTVGRPDTGTPPNQPDATVPTDTPLYKIPEETIVIVGHRPGASPSMIPFPVGMGAGSGFIAAAVDVPRVLGAVLSAGVTGHDLFPEFSHGYSRLLSRIVVGYRGVHGRDRILVSVGVLGIPSPHASIAAQRFLWRFDRGSWRKASSC
jgi:RHS repeat-associated protein